MTDALLLEASDLGIRVAGRSILSQGNLRILPGEAVCVVGPSGAGKSMLLRTLVGLLPASEGRVTLLGETIRSGPPRGLAARLGVAFQEGALFQSMTIAENLAMVLELAASREPAGPAVAAMLARVGLEAFGEARPADLSGGMRKRAGLARALVARPELLLLDEPTSGLDPVTAREISRLVASCRGQAGMLVVTHDPELVAIVADRTLVLEGGALRPAADDPWWQAFAGAGGPGRPC